MSRRGLLQLLLAVTSFAAVVWLAYHDLAPLVPTEASMGGWAFFMTTLRVYWAGLTLPARRPVAAVPMLVFVFTVWPHLRAPY